MKLRATKRAVKERGRRRLFLPRKPGARRDVSHLTPDSDCADKRAWGPSSLQRHLRNTHWFFLTPWKKAKGEVQNQGSHVGGILRADPGMLSSEVVLGSGAVRLRFKFESSIAEMNGRISRSASRPSTYRCQAPR